MKKPSKRAESTTLPAATLRPQAEEILRKKHARSPEKCEALSIKAAQRLLHELEVHQLELEMQNEELRRAQAELDAARARYFDLYDLAPVGYVTVSEKGLILEANLTAATLLGVGRNALDQQPLSRFILQDDQDIFYRLRQQLLETGVPQACELRMVKRDGTTFWGNLAGTATQNAAATPVCRIVLSDITEGKRVEDVLTFLAQTSSETAGEPFFNALARYLARSLEMDFVCIDRLEGDGLTAQTVAVWCGGKFEDNVTYALKDTPCGEVVGKTICCFPKGVRHLFPKDRALQQLQAESYVGTTLWSFEGTPIGLIAIIGQKPLVNPRLAEAVLKLVAGRAAGELERKRAEAVLQSAHNELEQRVRDRTWELTQANQALREREECYRTVADFAYDWEYWLTPDGRLPYVSPSCERLTGYRSEEFQQDPGLLIRIVHPDDRSHFANLHCDHSHAASGVEPRELDFRILTRNGEERWIGHIFQEVHARDGKFLGRRVSNRDITERLALEREILNISKREQRRIGEDLHDGLGQQLTAIELMCSSLQNDLPASQPKLKDQAAKMDQFLREAIRQTRVLARDLTGFKLTAHGLPAALAELAQNISAVGRVQCRLVCPAPVSFNIPTVAGHLYRIAQEAVHNAVKHAQASRVTIRLTQQGVTCLQVADDGQGWPHPIPPKPGMGLRVMKHRASIIGAQLQVESQPSRGVTVTCTWRGNEAKTSDQTEGDQQ
jgi:PAS domain S-box-containing protein